MDRALLGKPKQKHWISYIRQRIRRNKNFLGFISGQTGCQPKGSKVLMANGLWKNIEDIKKGDLILSPQINGSNLFSRVMDTTEWESKENYDIVELNRRHRKLYSCSFNHLIPLYHQTISKINRKKGNHKAHWKIVNYVAERFSQMSNNQKSHNNIGFSSFMIDKFKDRQNCLIEPYTLGVYLSDGHYSNYCKVEINNRYKEMRRSDKQYFKKKICGALNITSPDIEIMKEISKFYAIFNIHSKRENKAKSYRFGINSNLAKLLDKYRLTNKKSGDKFIPEDALLSDSKYRLRLLSGLIDGDGYYKNGGYSITTKSKALSDNIMFLVYSLGGRGSLTKVKKGIKKLNFVGEYYNVSFYLKDLKLDLKCKRKIKNMSCVYKSSNRIAINCIRNEKIEKVYGFTLDSPSKLYITDNFMVTHNSGKSYSCLSIGHDVDPNFSIDRVVFSGRELMNLINSGKLSKGSVVVFEEVGVAVDARNWQSINNKMINYLLQTFRHRNIILLMNAPYRDFIDTNSRKLFHAEMRTIGIDLEKKEARLMARLLQYNDRKKKMYYKRLIVISNKQQLKVDVWRVPMPPKELIQEYEKKKDIFTKRLNRRIMEDLMEAEDKRNLKTALTENQEEILSLLEQGMTVMQIAKTLNRSKRAVTRSMQYIKGKGYKFKPVKDPKFKFRILRYEVISPYENKEDTNV